jgi:hypothetical protein
MVDIKVAVEAASNESPIKGNIFVENRKTATKPRIGDIFSIRISEGKELRR